MPGFHLYSSNSQKKLLVELANNLSREPLDNPLEQEKIIVQSYGTQRWVSMELSRITGILANARFLFPLDLMDLAFDSVIDNYQSESAMEKDKLTWKLFSILADCKNDPELESLNNYLTDGSNLKRFQLAEQLSGLYHQYCLFRPDWIIDWESASLQGWQSHLWKKLVKNDKKLYKPHFQQQFKTSVQSLNSNPFPTRISIFGISTLPPMIIELLFHISRYSNVDFYFLNPSKEFWIDILSRKEIAKIKDKQGQAEEELYLVEGNSLFASFCQQGKHFYHLLIENGLIEDYGKDLFHIPKEPVTLLEHIQADIFYLREPEFVPVQSTPDDNSVQFHSCHTPMREVEVLLDQLLDIMSANPEVTPDDIVVMCPDIEEYSSIIKAVFSLDTITGGKIPFSIADQGFLKKSGIIQYFFKLLDLVNGRFLATDILELLESNEIRHRFDLNKSDVEMIRNWIEKVNIRWGIDETFRQNVNTPQTYETTWKYGIDRLLTGFALPLRNKEVFTLAHYHDILPYDEIEGNQSRSFGNFLRFYTSLTDMIQEGPYNIKGKRSLADWSKTLKDLFYRFFALTDNQATEVEALLQVLNEPGELGDTIDFHEEIDLDIIYTFLKTKLEGSKSRTGFLGSGITFCSMLPMRSIPFKVIALIGLNDKSFPRIKPPVSFDLMSAGKRLGDRSIREEDRYIFLEALLAAENVFYISYIGQSIVDNSFLFPGTIVSEFKNYIETGYETRRQIQTNHPLQAFSPKYFENDSIEFFSYSSDNLNAAKQIVTPQKPPVPFLTSLPPADEEYLIDENTLTVFFKNPSEYLIKNRLGIVLDDYYKDIDEHEPFTIDHLTGYLMREELLREMLQQHDSRDTRKRFAAAGNLPLSTPGIVQFKSLETGVKEFYERVSPYLEENLLPTLPFDFKIDNVRFSGSLDQIRERGIVHFRTAKTKTGDHLRLWIDHLMLTHITQNPVSSVLITQSPKSGSNTNDIIIYQFSPVENALSCLKTFVRYFKQGNRSPLAFFPQTAMKYYEGLSRETKAEAIYPAELEWYGNGEFKKGERENSYVNLAFKHLDLLDTGFENISIDILRPMMENQIELKK